MAYTVVIVKANSNRNDQISTHCGSPEQISMKLETCNYVAGMTEICQSTLRYHNVGGLDQHVT